MRHICSRSAAVTGYPDHMASLRIEFQPYKIADTRHMMRPLPDLISHRRSEIHRLGEGFRRHFGQKGVKIKGKGTAGVRLPFVRLPLTSRFL